MCAHASPAAHAYSKNRHGGMKRGEEVDFCVLSFSTPAPATSLSVLTSILFSSSCLPPHLTPLTLSSPLFLLHALYATCHSNVHTATTPSTTSLILCQSFCLMCVPCMALSTPPNCTHLPASLCAPAYTHMCFALPLAGTCIIPCNFPYAFLPVCLCCPHPLLPFPLLHWWLLYAFPTAGKEGGGGRTQAAFLLLPLHFVGSLVVCGVMHSLPEMDMFG